MDKPKIFGAEYSVYVRISRLCLHEKHIEYDLIPVDIFAPDGVSASYLERHPFGKIPAFEHDGFRLYETGAITRYVDEAFQGAVLQPSGLRKRARMNQIISIADGYLYPQLVWGMYVELVSKADRRISRCLELLDDLLHRHPVVTGLIRERWDRHADGYATSGPVFDLPIGMSVEQLEVYISFYAVRLTYVFKSATRQKVHFSFALPEMPIRRRLPLRRPKRRWLRPRPTRKHGLPSVTGVADWIVSRRRRAAKTG